MTQPALSSTPNMHFSVPFDPNTNQHQAFDGNGAAIVSPYPPAASVWSYAAASGGIVDTTVTQIAPAAGAGLHNEISSLQIEAGTLGAATEAVIQDGPAGAILWRTKLQTSGSPTGFSAAFNPPLRGSANTALEFALLTAITSGAVYVNAQGFTGA